MPSLRSVAMDLATGARDVYVKMSLLTRSAAAKLVARCDYPLTGVGCVSRVYTDHGVFEVTPDGFGIIVLFGDNTAAQLRELTGLRFAGER
ncbi:hypothetical protein GCM10010921_31130 [Microbacterium album]|uniref:Uncharacterized protein n=1 Tax=Microbacterium album TaxID=2053191 RepID=A0A917IJW6_9MICO|nr:hypothetical protein GCM10010921_31130 [Microbacterium album]